MGCCLAVAFLMALARRVWFVFAPPAAEPALFATPAVRTGPGGADRPSVAAPAAFAASPARPVRKPRVLAATVLAHAIAVQALVWLDVMVASDRSWVARDVALGLVLAITLLRPGGSLLTAGLLWSALGVVDMHAFGVIEVPAGHGMIDVLFHLSGIWVATAGFAIFALARLRTDQARPRLRQATA